MGLGLAMGPGCSGDDAVGGLGGSEGAADAGPRDLASPPIVDAGSPRLDGGVGARDLGPVEPGEELERLCNANCDLLSCADPSGTVESLCREACGRPVPGVDPEAEGCAEAATDLAACLEALSCDQLDAGICGEEQERFVSACVGQEEPPPPEVPPELERFCEASCGLTDRCIFPAPGCRDACIQGFGQGDLDGAACARALDNAAQCLDRVECRELRGGEPPCQVALGLTQFACR